MKCHYLGLVYVDTPHTPGQNEVEHTAERFRNLKKLRKEHPLFARGFSKALNLNANPEGIQLEHIKSQEGAVVSVPMKKLEFAASVSRSLFVVAKRGANKYNCHAFRLDSVQIACDAAELIQKAIVEHSGAGCMRSRSRSTENLLDFVGEGKTPERVPTFKAKSRLSSRTKSFDNLLSISADDSGIAPRTSEWGADAFHTPRKPAKLPSAAVSPADSGLGSEPPTPPIQGWGSNAQPGNAALAPETWFRGMITRAQAEALLHEKETGTFLVRVSQSRVGFSISLVLRTAKLQHFKVNQAGSGEYYVVGNSYAMFESLNELVYHYNQRRLTQEHDLLLTPIGPGPTSEDLQEYL